MTIRLIPAQLAITAFTLSLLPMVALADQWQDIQQRKELRCWMSCH